jgi:hypothetical protein
MAPPKESEPALAAPGLTGAMSIEKPPMGGPRSLRRSKNRPYAHVALELEVDATGKDPETPSKDKTTIDASGILGQSVGLLHALAKRRFRTVETWSVHPGGLDLPPKDDDGKKNGVGVGDLVAAIESRGNQGDADARSFTALLTDLAGQHVAVKLRHATFSKRRVLELDLTGSWTKSTVHALEGSIAERLPVVKSEWKSYRYDE